MFNGFCFVEYRVVGNSDCPDAPAFEEPFIAASIFAELSLMISAINFKADRTSIVKLYNEVTDNGVVSVFVDDFSLELNAI